MKGAALELGLNVRQPASLRRDEDAQREIRQLAPDAIVVAAYGLFLPSDTLRAPSLGCANIHPSLLPRYRGPSPVVSALLDGGESTGVTLMVPDEGMDTGPILAARETAISERENAPALTARLFELGAALLVETLPAWERGEVLPWAQDDAQASVTSLVRREHGEIDWRRSARQVERMTRAYQPWPGAFTMWRGSVLKVVDARVRESGTVDDAQPPGRRRRAVRRRRRRADRQRRSGVVARPDSGTRRVARAGFRPRLQGLCGVAARRVGARPERHPHPQPSPHRGGRDILQWRALPSAQRGL